LSNVTLSNYLHGDDVPACPETSTAVYRGLVSDYLSKPFANKGLHILAIRQNVQTFK